MKYHTWWRPGKTNNPLIRHSADLTLIQRQTVDIIPATSPLWRISNISKITVKVTTDSSLKNHPHCRLPHCPPPRKAFLKTLQELFLVQVIKSITSYFIYIAQNHNLQIISLDFNKLYRYDILCS